jgi:hypothetical protein
VPEACELGVWKRPGHEQLEDQVRAAAGSQWAEEQVAFPGET